MENPIHLAHAQKVPSPLDVVGSGTFVPLQERVHGERAGDGRGHHTQGARHRDSSSLS